MVGVVDVEVPLVDEVVGDVEVMMVVVNVEVSLLVIEVEVPLVVVEVPHIVDAVEVCLGVALVSVYFPFRIYILES